MTGRPARQYPVTPHLRWLSDQPLAGGVRLSDAGRAALLASALTVEEKVDGDNIGFSTAGGAVRVQRRRAFLGPHDGWRYPALDAWRRARTDRLVSGLGEQLILFGEWCAARHTLPYDRLPDWFLAFDILDRRSGAFWDTGRRDAWCAEHGIAVVPRIAAGRFDETGLLDLIGPSALGDVTMEGVVVRAGGDGILRRRAKLIRADFVQADSESWRPTDIRMNRAPDRSRR